MNIKLHGGHTAQTLCCNLFGFGFNTPKSIQPNFYIRNIAGYERKLAAGVDFSTIFSLSAEYL